MKRILAPVVSLLLIGTQAGSAWECAESSPCERLQGSSVFFVGRVSADPKPLPLGPVPQPESPDSREPPSIVSLEVLEPLFGIDRPKGVNLEIRGSSMRAGEVWLVNASRATDGVLRPWTCGHTVIFDATDPIYRFLHERLEKLAAGLVYNGTVTVRVTADLHVVSGARVMVRGPAGRMRIGLHSDEGRTVAADPCARG